MEARESLGDFVLSKFCFYSDLLTVGFWILYYCLGMFMCAEGLNCLTVAVEISQVLNNESTKYHILAIMTSSVGALPPLGSPSRGFRLL